MRLLSQVFDYWNYWTMMCTGWERGDKKGTRPGPGRGRKGKERRLTELAASWAGIWCGGLPNWAMEVRPRRARGEEK